jgi:restriction system protein
VVRAGKGGRNAADFEQLGLIAIGFAEAGNPTGLSREQLFEQTRANAGSRAGNIAGQVDRFARVMRPGDLVAIPDGGTRELLCGRIAGDFEYRDVAPIAHFDNVRSVDWIARRDRDDLPDRILYTLGSLLTVFKPDQQDALRRFIESGEVPSGGAPEPGGIVEDPEAEDSHSSAADQEASNLELIAKRIASIGPYEMQDLAAGILKALGYATEAAPPGADGGIDIRACQDSLFLQPPIVKAQVKARPGNKTGPDEIRQLKGLLEPGTDRGIFVSTGGFTAPASKEAEQMQIQLWDLDRVAELFLENYEALPEGVADLVPLRRIWVLDSAASK